MRVAGRQAGRQAAHNVRRDGVDRDTVPALRRAVCQFRRKLLREHVDGRFAGIIRVRRDGLRHDSWQAARGNRVGYTQR